MIAPARRSENATAIRYSSQRHNKDTRPWIH